MSMAMAVSTMTVSMSSMAMSVSAVAVSMSAVAVSVSAMTVSMSWAGSSLRREINYILFENFVLLNFFVSSPGIFECRIWFWIVRMSMSLNNRWSSFDGKDQNNHSQRYQG